MITKHAHLDWPERLVGQRFGSQVVTSIATVVRGGGKSQRTRVWALCDCGAKEILTLHALRARAKTSGACKACRRRARGTKGRTWRVTCRRCGGKGHLAKTCTEERAQ